MMGQRLEVDSSSASVLSFLRLLIIAVTQEQTTYISSSSKDPWKQTKKGGGTVVLALCVGGCSEGALSRWLTDHRPWLRGFWADAEAARWQ